VDVSGTDYSFIGGYTTISNPDTFNPWLISTGSYTMGVLMTDNPA
jgi:hypothetical protein